MRYINNIINQKYEIDRLISNSGNAWIYHAKDLEWNKEVAIKIIPWSGNTDDETITDYNAPNHDVKKKNGEEIRENAQTEAQILGMLDIQHVPRYYDYLEENSCSFIIMEYIDGENLEDYISKNGKMAAREAIEIARQVAIIINDLHKRNPPILFLDLKPGNIVLSKGNICFLVDYGAAYYDGLRIPKRRTEIFAAPEQKSEHGQEIKVDQRTDIYCLGTTLSYLLEKTVISREQKIHCKNEFEKDIWAIVQKCMEIEPEDRFQSCDELLDKLESTETKTYIWEKESLNESDEEEHGDTNLEKEDCSENIVEQENKNDVDKKTFSLKKWMLVFAFLVILLCMNKEWVIFAEKWIVGRGRDVFKNMKNPSVKIPLIFVIYTVAVKTFAKSEHDVSHDLKVALAELPFDLMILSAGYVGSKLIISENMSAVEDMLLWIILATFPVFYFSRKLAHAIGDAGLRNSYKIGIMGFIWVISALLFSMAVIV